MVPAKTRTRRLAPRKLSRELIDRLIDGIARCNSLKDAAVLAGIDRHTVARWRAQAEEDDAPPLMIELRDRLEHAEAERNDKLVSIIRDAAEGKGERDEHGRPLVDWRASGWLLTHVGGPDWTNKTRKEVSGSVKFSWAAVMEQANTEDSTPAIDVDFDPPAIPEKT